MFVTFIAIVEFIMLLVASKQMELWTYNKIHIFA